MISPAPAAASSNRPAVASSSVSTTVVRRSRSNSRPITAATDRACSVGSPRRATRCATTSRTLDGRSRSSRSVDSTQRPVVVLRERAGLGEVADHLDQEERVAGGLAAQRLDQGDAVVGHLVPGRVARADRGCRCRRGRRRSSRSTLGSRRRSASAPVSGWARDRSLSRKVPTTVHRHRDPGRDQVAQHLQAGGVDPVQVVEHQHDRRVRRGEREQAGHAFEDQEPLGVRVAARLGHREGEPPGEVRHQAGERESVGVDELAAAVPRRRARPAATAPRIHGW